jgi:hypothetical protein
MIMRCLDTLPRSYFLLLIGCFVSQLSFGQGGVRYSSYFECLGNSGTFISLNVDRCSACDSLAAFSFAQRVGFSFSFNQYVGRPAFHFPMEVSAIHGRGRWKFEYGVGCTPYIGTSDLSDDRIPVEYKSNHAIWTVFRIGVRKNLQNGGVLRIAPLYVFERWSNGRSSELWSIGIAWGGYLYRRHGVGKSAQ